MRERGLRTRIRAAVPGTGAAAAVVGGAVALVWIAAGPALSATPSSWTAKPKMPWLEVLGIYAGIPILLFVIITTAVMMPSLLHGPRYRPGLSWWAEPQWFGGPRDGAQGATTHSTPPRPRGEDQPGRGGASARW
ncbi:MAG: aa3-type cytochrome oxidase subunit CtaJ [Nocardioidaceae bacterium]